MSSGESGHPRDPLSVACTACLADVGEQCYSVSSDEPRRPPHRLRALSAQRQLELCGSCNGMGWQPARPVATPAPDPDAGMAFAQTIGVDFDGVIHQYTHWCAVENDPVEGAFDALYTLLEHHAVFIFCARPYETTDRIGGGLREIPGWFKRHGFRHPVVCDWGLETRFWTRRNVILVTNQKLPALVYIDDRAIRFHHWGQALDDVRRHAGRLER